MQAAIMQPYFFPYVGYWQLFFNCDVWVFFDIPQYNKKSWMNRNRILHPEQDKEYQYINVPIRKMDRTNAILKARINSDELWAEKILAQLNVYKKLRAPYYEDVHKLIESTLSTQDEGFLSLTLRIADTLCAYLDIKVNYKIATELIFDRSSVKEPGDWALNICQSLGVNQYINPYGGAEIFDVDKYRAGGVDIKFLRPNLSRYEQSNRSFIAGLSIIDILMFNSKDQIRHILSNDFELLEKEKLMKG